MNRLYLILLLTVTSSAMLSNVNVQIGIRADWLVVAFGEGEGYGGLLLGVRAGCQLSPPSTGWRTIGTGPSTLRHQRLLRDANHWGWRLFLSATQANCSLITGY